MNPFEYRRAEQPDTALQAIGRPNHTKLLAGGTNLIDLMKNGVEQPDTLVDINRLPLSNIEKLPNGGVRLGALARNSDTADHPLVRQNYPLLSQAILAGASPQLRNMATNGGNLLQRTRCYYFTDAAFPECNKRAPGSGCGAIDGFNRIHAILGASPQCIATHPSDMCVALAALDATIRVQSARGERAIPMEQFHRLPGGTTPQLDTNLAADELIVSIDLQPSTYAGHCHYLKRSAAIAPATLLRWFPLPSDWNSTATIFAPRESRWVALHISHGVRRRRRMNSPARQWVRLFLKKLRARRCRTRRLTGTMPSRWNWRGRR